MLFKRFRKKQGLYDLRKTVAKWVEKNLGKEYVDEALDKYDKVNRGIPIGGILYTIAFLDMVERVKAEL